MSDKLFIRFTDTEAIEWGVLDPENSEQGFLERGHLLIADVEALRETANNKDIIVLIPAIKVRCFGVEVPTKNKKHLAKAIPYLLEEQLAESVETQHFALGAINHNTVQVNVVDKAYLQQLLSVFSDADIIPDMVISEASCLPVFNDGWTVLDGDISLIRQNSDEYYACEKEITAEILNWNLQLQLEKNTQENDDVSLTQAIRLYSENGHSEILQGMAGFAVQQFETGDSFLWLTHQYKNHTINLLQDEFASKKKSNKGLGYWKISAIAAVSLLTVGLIYFSSYLYTLQSTKNDLKQQILSQIQQVRPNAEDVESGLFHLNNSFRQIGASSSGKGFVHHLETISQNINSDQLTLEQMEYLAKRSELSFDIKAQTYAQLTETQTKLEQSGFNVDMRNASESGGKWGARMVVKVAQ